MNRHCATAARLQRHALRQTEAVLRGSGRISFGHPVHADGETLDFDVA